MIVPRNRLLFWFAVIILPFSFLGAVEPAAAAVSLLALAGFVGLVLIDGAGAPGRLAGLEIELPPLTRMSKDRPAKLVVRIRNTNQKPGVLRLTLGLPRELESPQDEMTIALPAGSEWSQVSWSCVPRRRGNFRLEQAGLEIHSPLGFWEMRKRVRTASEIRVYPNLVAARKDLAALFLHRGSFGLHAQRQLGKGREFEKLREYIPGDGYDEIHWKATAKRGRPITKVFQIERTQEVYVVIDASRLSARASESSPVARQASGLPSCSLPSPIGGPRAAAVANETRVIQDDRPLELRSTVLERFMTAALLLGLAAEQQGDLFGLITFSNKVENFIRAKTGKLHYSTCRDGLYLLEPQVVTPDFDELCTFIRLRLRRRALLVFLTALDDPVLAEGFVRNMDLIRRQHLVLVNMLRPPGVQPLFSDPAVTTVDDLYRHLGGHMLWQNLRELEKVLQRRGVQFSLLPNERLTTELVSQYLSVKRRQSL